jgi:acetyl esterase/lipase
VADLEGNLGNPDQSSRVQAVCDWFGPTDFCRMSEGESTMDHDAANSPESQLIGGPVQQNKDKAARANPITYVTKDDPPFLIMHGDRDRTVPPNQSQLLHAALQTAGVETTLHMVAGAGHGGFGADAQQMVYDFFDKHLKAPPAGASAPASGQ